MDGTKYAALTVTTLAIEEDALFNLPGYLVERLGRGLFAAAREDGRTALVSCPKIDRTEFMSEVRVGGRPRQFLERLHILRPRVEERQVGWTYRAEAVFR